MARRTRQSFRRSGAPRRSTEWIASAVITGSSSLAAATAVLDQSINIAEQSTIVRTRGSLFVKSDQVAANEQPFGALGMAVVTDQANAIGITAMPTPTTD